MTNVSKRLTVFVCIGWAIASPALAQGFRAAAMENRPWYEPLLAEPRGAHVQALAIAKSKEFPFMVEPGSRRIWEVHLGKEIPIVLWERGTAGGDIVIDQGGWGFGVWTPVDFHMVEDFVDKSNPIINTDYRFAGALKIAHGISADSRWSAKFQFGHESTHLGDEFTIHAMDKHGSSFERVNVSYEYFEAGVSWERIAGSRMVTVRGSALKTADRGKPGFYSPELLDGSRTLITSARNLEPAIGFEVVPITGSGWGLWPLRGWAPLASIDTRWRTVYDYAKTAADEREASQWSTSVVVGLRKMGAVQSRGVPDLIVKGYYGVNPNGQFRSQKNYWMFGFGVHVRV